jgi:8-oxo-(d)GTP phosphatase
MPILLVRHAKAGNRQDWAGDDRLRPLSPAGARQADDLAKRLTPYHPVRVLSSPYTRCRQTVEPLAAAVGVKVDDSEELAEGRSHEAIELIRRLAAESEDAAVVLCSHGDVIPEVLDYFAREDELDLGRAPRCAKGSTWVLDAAGGRFVKATYLPSSDSARHSSR